MIFCLHMYDIHTDCISEMTICVYKNSFQFQRKLFYWYFHFSLSQDWDLTDSVPMKIMIMKLNQMVTNIKNKSYFLQFLDNNNYQVLVLCFFCFFYSINNLMKIEKPQLSKCGNLNLNVRMLHYHN